MRQINYITTHTGLKVMEEFFLRSCFFHKGVVFLLSVVEGIGIWTTHFTEDQENKKMKHYGPLFRMDHEKQLQELYDKAKSEQEQEDPGKIITIDDQTASSKFVLRQSARLMPGDHVN